ncbi:MAG: glycosyltransferase family A protein [Candidatus Hydrogenedens sp.]
MDSSDDETVKIIQNLKKELPINLIRQPLLGPKVARETGLKNINYKFLI